MAIEQQIETHPQTISPDSKHSLHDPIFFTLLQRVANHIKDQPHQRNGTWYTAEQTTKPGDTVRLRDVPIITGYILKEFSEDPSENAHAKPLQEIELNFETHVLTIRSQHPMSSDEAELSAHNFADTFTAELPPIRKY